MLSMATNGQMRMDSNLKNYDVFVSGKNHWKLLEFTLWEQTLDIFIFVFYEHFM